MVVLIDEVEHPPGMCPGGGQITEQEGLAGPVDGDRTG
jgi:hypothetical protein